MNTMNRILTILLLAVIALADGSAIAQTNRFSYRPVIKLFDGKTLEGWVTAKGDPVTQGWEVLDGAIHLKQGGPRGGNILTDREYENFELRFEWKIARDGNSGIKYRVQPFPGKGLLGCEFQILDDGGHKDGETSRKSTGSLYDVYPPNASKYLKPVGEYNQSRIVVWQNQLQHWLNGRMIVCANVGSADWYRRKAESKFRTVDGFGENSSGLIMLTDHSSEVWYRGLELRPLVPACPSRDRQGLADHLRNSRFLNLRCLLGR